MIAVSTSISRGSSNVDAALVGLFEIQYCDRSQSQPNIRYAARVGIIS